MYGKWRVGAQHKSNSYIFGLTASDYTTVESREWELGPLRDIGRATPCCADKLKDYAQE
jgi:hypothetical protein